MNYIDQINGFWEEAESKDLTGNDIAVYFALLNYNNRLMWMDTFVCHWDIVCQSAGISKNTYYKCMERLNDAGLIHFEIGIRNVSKPKVSILKFENRTGTEREQKGNRKGTEREQKGNIYKHTNLQTSKPTNDIAEKKISSVSAFESNRDKLIEAAKEKYPDKNCERAFDDMAEYCKIKGAKYLDYKLAYFKWVRDDRFQKYDSQTTAGPRLKPEFRHIKNWEDKTYGETENLFYYTIFDVTQNAWRYIKASQQEKIRVSGIHGADKLISCHE
jgi:hypothetical protein